MYSPIGVRTGFRASLFRRFVHGSDSTLSVIRQHNSVSSEASSPSCPLTLPSYAPSGRESATCGMRAASLRNGSPNSRTFTRITSAASKAGRRIRAIWLSAGSLAHSESIRPRCSEAHELVTQKSPLRSRIRGCATKDYLIGHGSACASTPLRQSLVSPSLSFQSTFPSIHPRRSARLCG